MMIDNSKFTLRFLDIKRFVKGDIGVKSERKRERIGAEPAYLLLLLWSVFSPVCVALKNKVTLYFVCLTFFSFFLIHFLVMVDSFIFQQFIAYLYKYLCSVLLPKQTTNRKNNSIALQYYKGKTLVLDLDETLVHSVRVTEAKHIHHKSIKKTTIEVTSDKQSILYEVYKRPHVDFFLSTVITFYCS
jgi:hypothetical protein